MPTNSDLNKIGFYQLDNLIANRVPFLFVNMSESLVDWYSSVSRLHVQTFEVLLNSTEVMIHIESHKIPKDYAIVLLCNDGHSSLQLCNQLEKNNYTNVYVVDGGYQQIVTERAQL